MTSRLSETSIPQAIKLAFPELEPRAARIIAGWYEAEGAAEDFESTAELAEHIESDITEMLWAASDPKEIAIVKAGLVNGRFVDADSLPEEEFDESRRTRESSDKITWSSFDTPESNALEEKYLPDHGDGDNMASQAVTAATKLIYKWFNDGDVYDNSYGLSGWANDISGSANWLAKHVPGARDILWRIQKTHSEEEYVSNILWPLFNLVYDSKLLSSLEKKPKVDDAYSCKGPFEFNYEDEDAYQEEDPESFGDYDQDYEPDESTRNKNTTEKTRAYESADRNAKLVRKQEHRYYASSNDRLTVLYVDGRPVTKEYDVIVPEGTKYANTRGSWRMPLGGSEIEENASKLLRRYNSGFSIAAEEFEFRGGYGYILRVLRNEDLPEPATARELYDHESMSELWGTPEEYFAHEGREDLVELARSEAASESAPHPRTRESAGRKYKLEYVLYSRGDVYRKVGSFSAPSDQEACKKAAMIQANYGPLKDLDAKARAELEEDVMIGFEEYPEQHSDPIEAWDSYITYNSEEFSVRLTAPDGRVLVDTGMDDFAEEEDFEESKKTSIGKLAEGKYAAGGRAPQDEYDDIIEDVLNGWDIAGPPQDSMTLPTDALEQIEDALKAYDPSLSHIDVQDVIDTYFEHSASTEPREEATVGDIEDESFELRMDGFPDEDVQHRLSQKYGLSRGEVGNILAYESKASVKSILREAAKPVQQDKLGSWYKEAFRESYRDSGDGYSHDITRSKGMPLKAALKEAAVDNASAYARLIDTTKRRGRRAGAKQAERYVQFAQEKAARFAGEADNARELYVNLESAWLDGALQGFESRKNDLPYGPESSIREALADKDWSEFQHYMFNAISEVYQRFNIGKGSGEATADKMDLIKVLDWMDAHGFWDDQESIVG